MPLWVYTKDQNRAGERRHDACSHSHTRRAQKKDRVEVWFISSAKKVRTQINSQLLCWSGFGVRFVVGLGKRWGVELGVLLGVVWSFEGFIFLVIFVDRKIVTKFDFEMFFVFCYCQKNLMVLG